MKNKKYFEIKDVYFIKYENNILAEVVKNVNMSIHNYFHKTSIDNLLLKKYDKINSSKLDLYKKEIKFSIKNITIIIFDIRSLKTKIIVLNQKKTLSSLTNGVIFKKLQLRNKKYKKSSKLTFMLMKTIILKFNYFKKFKNLIVEIKGLKKNINDYLYYINKNINKNGKNIIFINNNRFSTDKKFKFKKIRAIKRKLKKKLVRFK